MFLYSVPKFSNGSNQFLLIQVVPTSHLFVDKVLISSAPPDDSLKKKTARLPYDYCHLTLTI